MADTIPTREELINNARALRPLLLENQDATEANRRVSGDVFEQILDAGLYKVLQPKR